MTDWKYSQNPVTQAYVGLCSDGSRYYLQTLALTYRNAQATAIATDDVFSSTDPPWLRMADGQRSLHG